MKFTIVSRGDQRSNDIQTTMKQYLTDFDLIYDHKEPDLVISVGGDGTFLEAFHRYVHRLNETAFIGVHTGHLGFYADWLPNEVEKLIIEIAKTPFQVVEYPLLEVIIRPRSGGTEDRFLALNEATIKTVEGSVVFDVQIKGEHFETLRGDGLCISTPSGSTAFIKSLDDAHINPSINYILLTELTMLINSYYL